MTGTEGHLSYEAIDSNFDTVGTVTIHYADPYSGVNHSDAQQTGQVAVNCNGNTDGQPFQVHCTVV